MSEISRNNNIHRIIDANLNRVKEGFRVCEEITRFILDDHKFTALLKLYRHEIDGIVKNVYPAGKLLKERRSDRDVGRKNSCSELKRANLGDIFRANIQRVKESLRVLEEFSKLKDRKAALRFKRLRYKVYEIEKKSFKKISALPDLR
ncbi:MAG: thiamine-phosphate pyrophosphorylase [Candidatus Omnitrophota bacterium]|nr:thiamine-phosphate pyrophosphorylase [Candidatus Omnitrophota bacterium]